MNIPLLSNPRGLWTLFVREMHRFMKVKMQTLVAPVLTATLYLLIFRYAIGNRTVPGVGVDVVAFLIPGLVMMTMLQNAFANTSSSIITGKVMHVHIYLLMAPLTALEVVLAFLAAALVRALLVGLVLLLALIPFAGLSMPPHPWLILYYGVCGSLILAALGFVGGMWADKFDDMALINNFVILPLTLLSGVFFSSSQLPSLWQTINGYNPFFYLIDGFRYGFLGAGDTDPMQGIVATGLAALASALLCWRLWAMGWNMKE